MLLDSEAVSMIHCIRPSVGLSLSRLRLHFGLNSITKLLIANFIKDKMIVYFFATSLIVSTPSFVFAD